MIEKRQRPRYITGVCHIALHPATRGDTDNVLVLGTLPPAVGLHGKKAFMQAGATSGNGAAMLRIRPVTHINDYIVRTDNGRALEATGHVPRINVHKDGDFEVVLPADHPLVEYLRRCLGRLWTKRCKIDSRIYETANSVLMTVPRRSNVERYTGTKLNPVTSTAVAEKHPLITKTQAISEWCKLLKDIVKIGVDMEVPFMERFVGKIVREELSQ